MNGSSHPDPENRRYEGSPPQGPSKARRGSSVFFKKCSRLLIRRGDVPSGAAAFITHN